MSKRPVNLCKMDRQSKIFRNLISKMLHIQKMRVAMDSLIIYNFWSYAPRFRQINLNI
jgi:hypothetical protein